MNNFPILVTNRLVRLSGNIFKVLAYPFHYLFPNKRFTIPSYSPARVKLSDSNNIPRQVWLTNFTNKVTLPVYCNYLFNRLLSLEYDYHYVDNDGCEQYLREHAPKEVYESYLKLTDGAAKADLWRVTTLYQEGGVYMDVDATLVWKLKKLLNEVNNSLYIKIKNDTEITNYFLATTPNNPEYKTVMEAIVYNINNYDPEKGVYGTTGPKVFNDVLDEQKITSRRRRYVCIQGAFTNEHFQYIDKPRGKWIHKDPNELIK